MAAETTTIKSCNCQHEWQDKKYGKGNRLHNLSKSKSPGVKAWTCTVCAKKTE